MRQGVGLALSLGWKKLPLLSTTSGEGDVFGQKLAPTLPEVPTL